MHGMTHHPVKPKPVWSTTNAWTLEVPSQEVFHNQWSSVSHNFNHRFATRGILLPMVMTEGNSFSSHNNHHGE
jgi:hypothetical protein